MKIGINIECDNQAELERVVAALSSLQPHAPAASPAPVRANGHNARPANGYSGNGGGRLITPKQKGLILSICKREGIDPFSSCRQTWGCDIDALPAHDASTWIDQLQGAGVSR